MKLNGKFQLKGGCLCGYVRYELTLQPEGATYCHCDDCRRMTGRAFRVGVHVPVKGFSILSGKI